MKRFITFSLAGVVILAVLFAATVLIAPRLIDIAQHKPAIERFIIGKTGLPVRLGGEISLSLFPSIALSFTDLQIDSLAGPTDQPLLSIDGFEARLKTLPLLSKQIEISSFIVTAPQLNLVIDDAGSGNWQKQTPSETMPAERGEPAPTAPGAIPPAATPPQTDTFVVTSLIIDELAIKDGRVRLDNRASQTKREVSGIFFESTDISLDQPVSLALAAMLDGRPIELTGTVGPLGSTPGSGPVAFNLHVSGFDTLQADAVGTVTNLLSDPRYTVDLDVEPGNLKRLIAAISPDATVITADPQALEHVGFRGTLQGSREQIDLSGSALVIDETTISVERSAIVFSGPALELVANIDTLDLDRYLPPASTPDSTQQSGEDEPSTTPRKSPTTTTAPAGDDEKHEASPAGDQPATAPAVASAPDPATPDQATIDYQPLRDLQLTASVSVGTLRVSGGEVTNLSLQITGVDGLFSIAPMNVELYQGHLNSTAALDVRRNQPRITLKGAISNVQAGPLLRDFTQKNRIEGTLNLDIDITTVGDRTETLLASLNGTGNLFVKDGAINGLDLTRLTRTITTGFSLDDQGERPATDFGELTVPFTLRNGVVAITEATLQSPFIKAQAAGTADLVSQRLDLRLRPELVASLQGQGDDEQKPGYAIPTLIGGTFNEPTFRPDLEALAKERLPALQELEDVLKTGTISPENKQKLSEEAEKAKGLLKGLFGR